MSVILDGENAWEHYDGGGRPFLRALYRALAAAPRHRDGHDVARRRPGPAAPLPSIFPGSWINGDFYIWIGHRDDHRAWDQLSDARARVRRARRRWCRAEARDRALEELLIAEGSDWFWWYGDDHSSDHDADFDDLFRRHLRNAYAALGAPVPEELFATNISTGAGPDRLEPSGLLTITLDGRDTSFLEWVGAVAPPLARPGGAMHEVAASPLIAEVRVGAVRRRACAFGSPASSSSALIRSGAASLALVIAGDRGPGPADRASLDGVGRDRRSPDSVRSTRRSPPGSDLQFAIQVRDRSDAVLEAVPHGRHWTIAVPKPAAVTTDWQA